MNKHTSGYKIGIVGFSFYSGHFSMADNKAEETGEQRTARYRRVGWACHTKCSAYARAYFAQGVVTAIEEMVESRLEQFSTAAHAERRMIKSIMEAINDLEQNDVPFDKRMFGSEEWKVFVNTLCDFFNEEQLSVGISFARQMLDKIENAKCNRVATSATTTS